MKIPFLNRYLYLSREKRYSLADLDRDMDLLIAGRPTATGVSVTEKTALHTVAVFACVRLLAETVASLPLPVYRRLTPRGKERAPDHRLYSLLHDVPNPEMTSFTFRETLMGHLALWGNAFSEIDWDLYSGGIKGLWPLRPDRMQVGRMEKTKQLVYRYQLPDGTGVTLPAYRVLHIPGLGFDGIAGYSPISMARESIGLSLAAEEYGARFFGNGAKPGGVLEHPQKLSEPALENLRKSWNEMHQGLSNQHRIAILEEGMKYHQVGIPPNDAQFLETRKFQKAEIASFFHIPPHMIGDLERATFSNIEQQSIEFAIYTMRPWLVRWEQGINKQLLGPEERQRYFAEFLVDGLLRGDVQSRYAAYATGRQWGWLSANDIRELENQNPLPGDEGDIYLVPMNMVSAGGFRAKLDFEDRSCLKIERRKKATARFAITKSYAPMFNDMALRVIRAERRNVMAVAKKQLANRGVIEFNRWLDEYYQEQHPEFMEKHIRPVVRSLIEAIQAAAAGEIGKDPGMTPELDRFVDDYSKAAITRYIKSSKGQINSVVRDTVEEGTDAIEALDARFDEWEEKRPHKVSDRETVQASNAAARVVFASAGYALMWTVTSSEPCPFCESLDGQVVGRESNFVNAGQGLEAGQDIPLVPSTNISHPPLHAGCGCQILPA